MYKPELLINFILINFILINFILINFAIGFISDLMLNFLSRQSFAPDSIKALKVYFMRQTIKNPHVRDFISAASAGLTVMVALLITMVLSKLVLNFYQPLSFAQLWRFLLIAFPVGYIADIFIYKTELFGPTLNPYYKIAGVGFWGAAAFIFSILLSFIIIKYLKSI